MKYAQIGLGTKIELVIYDKNGDKLEPVLVSQFEVFDDKNNLMDIHAPFYGGKFYPIHPKTLMDIIFSKDGDTYSFQAEAVARGSLGRIILLKVVPVTPIQKIERRYFFRMECVLNVEYKTLNSLQPDENSEAELIDTVTRDISGGGVCILTDTEMKQGVLVEAYLHLDRKVRFIGTIARSLKGRENGRQVYHTGIEFKRIENRDREKIISYVFETQRERLKKGWMRLDVEN